MADCWHATSLPQGAVYQSCWLSLAKMSKYTTFATELGSFAFLPKDHIFLLGSCFVWFIWVVHEFLASLLASRLCDSLPFFLLHIFPGCLVDIFRPDDLLTAQVNDPGWNGLVFDRPPLLLLAGGMWVLSTFNSKSVAAYRGSLEVFRSAWSFYLVLLACLRFEGNQICRKFEVKAF